MKINDDRRLLPLLLNWFNCVAVFRNEGIFSYSSEMISKWKNNFITINHLNFVIIPKFHFIKSTSHLNFKYTNWWFIQYVAFKIENSYSEIKDLLFQISMSSYFYSFISISLFFYIN